MIESSSFGRMTIDGRHYTSDLILFPDGRVEANWWRRQGHQLRVDDMVALIDAAPHTIVVGTGTSGRLRPDDDLAPFLAARGIDLRVAPTARAAQMVNQQLAEKVRVGACFHLTC